MSRSAERLRELGIVVEDREAWELGRKLLDELEQRIGPELVGALVGAWLGRHHRERPRLMWARPEAPARADHYLAFVRELPCARCKAPPPSDPHHFGPRGVGEKCDDYRTVPLCRLCHHMAHRGEIRSWRPWLTERIVDTVVRYLRIVEQT